MSYVFHILILISLYAVLSASLNLLVGYTGLLSLCHAAFYGIGAYIGALSMTVLEWGFFPALLLAVAGSSLLSFTISVPSIRLRGDHFVLASLGFQVITFAILFNWTPVTRGPYGVAGIPAPSLLGMPVRSLLAFFLFSLVLAATCLLLLFWIGSSPFGRLLKAIREDEVAVASLGKNVARVKMAGFAVAAGFAAVPGVLYATYAGFIDPTSFTILESVFILSLVVVGGAGNLRGPLLGTVLLVLLPEGLRFMGIPGAVAANLRQIAYGVLLILVMRYRPQGLIGEYRFA